jgi:ATP-binding cassette subfamily B protein
MNEPRTIRLARPWRVRPRPWLKAATRQAGRLIGRRRRVPVRLQMSVAECGAACLAMILSYHGRQTRIAECREQMDVGRDGLSALAIAQAARANGLQVRAFSTTAPQLQQVPLPAIVHWNFNHFVVLERCTPRQVEIVDPAAGRRRLTPAEFEAGFTGLVLTFTPTDHFALRAATGGFNWRAFFLKLFRQMPGLFAQILVASFLLQLFGLVGPLFTKLLVDSILPGRLTNLMGVLGVGVMFLILGQVATSYLRAILLQSLQVRLDAQIMRGFFEHLLTLPFRFFEQRSNGDLLQRLSSNSIIRESLTSQTLSLVLDTTLILSYLAALLLREPGFGLCVIGTALLQVALLATSARRLHRLNERSLTAQAESQGYTIGVLNRIAMIKASGAERQILDQWSNLFYKELNVTLQQNRITALVDTGLTALRSVAPLVLLWYGALKVLDGSMSMGTMLALNALAVATLAPLASLVANGQRLQLIAAYLERLGDVWETQPEQQRAQVRPAPRLTGRIALEHVSFRYDANSPAVLHDISVTIQPGQKVALVGRTGSGKSSLLKLLLGLYPVTTGTIRYDGIPLQELAYPTLRSQCGVVLQEHFLLNGSIRENIALNAPDADLNTIVRAAQLAAVHSDIMQMGLNYETVLTDGGTGLSGGQCQRIALARALVHQPAILLLDEATSHLDVLTERQIETNLDQLSCTRIVIAHRLSTIRNADLILVLDQGTIVEQGTHAELLAQAGHYARLIQSQLGSETPDTTAATCPGQPSFHLGIPVIS